MKYKMMITALLLMPVACHASDASDAQSTNEICIQKLEDARFKKESAIAQLNRRILEESRPYFECINEALHLWIPLDGQDKKGFYKFINELAEKLNDGEDIIAMIEESLNVKNDVEDADFMILRIVLQEQSMRGMLSHYKELVRELVVINKELKHLR